jgi:hypothetical protein
MDHTEELKSLGLTKRVDELAADAKAGKKPPGTPKQMGKLTVYPPRHFA